MTNLKAIISGSVLCTTALTLLTTYAYKKGREDGMLIGGTLLTSMAIKSLNNDDEKES